MLELLIILVILAILILPIKLAAAYVGAKNSGILMCIVALIFAAVIQKAVAVLLPQLLFNYPALSPLMSILLSALAYMLVLGTSYGKGDCYRHPANTADHTVAVSLRTSGFKRRRLRLDLVRLWFLLVKKI